MLAIASEVGSAKFRVVSAAWLDAVTLQAN
jgi:hypothetical protein